MQAFVLSCLLARILTSLEVYRVIHKSLREFQLLRYGSRDGHAEGEHVNRGRERERHSKFLSYLRGARNILSAASVLIVAQPSSEVPEGLMKYPVYDIYDMVML